MLLHDDDIQEFKSIYQEEFNESLSDKEAREMASRVIRLYELLAQPLPSERVRALEKLGREGMLETHHQGTYQDTAEASSANPVSSDASPTHP